MVSPDEHQWVQVVRRSDSPNFGELLRVRDGEDLLDHLEHEWSGKRSYDLERVLREGDISVELFLWS